MSRNYEFSIMLDANYSEKNILSILEKGYLKGYIYQDDENTIVSAASAKEIIWQYYLKQSPPFINIKYNSTNFLTWFYNENNKIYLLISPTHIAWKKQFDLCGRYEIHFYRYQKFILDMIGNNLVTHLETYEWVTTSYNAEAYGDNKKIYIKFYTYWPYDIYHHFKVNSHILGMAWLDTHSQPINLKQEDNSLETILYNEDTTQCWYGIKDGITLKFTFHKKLYFIVEPIYDETSNCHQLDQKQVFNEGLRITIELFKNMPVLRFITFQEDKDIETINTMDEQ